MHEIVELNSGLALIRYVSDRPGDYNAIIEVEIPSGVSAVFDPSCNGPVLERPGQCVVIRCEKVTEIRLWPQTSAPGEQVRGSVTLEYLTKEQPSPQPSLVRRGGAPDMSAPAQAASMQTAQPARTQQQSASSDGLRLVGHLAYKGDIVASSSGWLGGPEDPARIEGVTVNWAHCPPGVELLLCDPATGQTCRTGEFLGTKGQARTLRGLEIWLEGRVPDDLSLHAEAVFERAGLVRKQGKWIALMGADSTDELIGLKLAIGPQAGAAAQFGGANVSAASQGNMDSDTNIAQSMGEVPPTQRQRTRLFRKRDF